MIKLNKEAILEALAKTPYFSKISSLLESFPWNNFLQLKIVDLYEEIMTTGISKGFREVILPSSHIGQTLITLGAKSKFDHASNRQIRHGYMAVVIKLANILITGAKNKVEVAEYLDTLGEDWKLFADGELKRSNDTNTKSLGGQQPRPSASDDDEMEGSMSMDSILSRFSNFNTELSKRQSLNSNNDDDDDDDDEDEDDDDNGDTK